LARQANKEPVRIREKKLKNGNISLYLDYYKDGERQYEFLKIYLIGKPKTPIEKQSNKLALEFAQRIKAKRIEEVHLGTFNLQSKSLTHTDFLKFFQLYIDKYTKADHRVLSACFNKFKAYLQERHGKSKLLCKDLTQNLIIGFKDYLESHLTGESPLTYYNRFRKVVKYGIRENLFHKNPLPQNLKFKSGGMTKGVLSLDEVAQLAETHCGNPIVKRAFLFACNTGLRFGDIKELRWKHINHGQLIMQQGKTKEINRLALNQNALQLAGERGQPEELIFQLPSFNGSAKTVKNWVKRAGIEKRITWHSARHSFATNILLLGYDIKTLSQLLGHTSIKHTQKYLSIADERKAQAVNALPNLLLK
jgi:integrase/recombinase XerD